MNHGLVRAAGCTAAVLLLGAALASREPALADHIAILGSSTAAGEGPSHPDSAWVNRYRDHLQLLDPAHEVTNLAVSGYATYHILPSGSTPPPGKPWPVQDHNITAALSLNPDAIVINLPSNDAAYGFSVAEQLANYEIVLAEAGGQGVALWISTTQPRNLDPSGRANLMEMRDSTFARFGERAIDFWSGLAQPDGRIAALYDSGDGIHLDDAAHRILFERVVGKEILAVLARVPGEDGGRSDREAHLLSIGPNPTVAGAATVHFWLPRPMTAQLGLFDTAGRLVAAAAPRSFPGGVQSLVLRTEELAAGIYFWELRTPTRGDRRRVAILR